MNRVICILVFLICSLGDAKETELFRDRALKKRAPIFVEQSVRMSDISSCQQKKCTAWLVASGQRPKLKTQSPAENSGKNRDYNPANDVCRQAGGSLDTFFEQDLSEISVCVFSDASFLYSWDLVRKTREQ